MPSSKAHAVKSRRRRVRIILAVLPVLLVLGSWKYVRAGFARVWCDFAVSEQDGRVFYEPGASVQADVVALLLPSAIETVEARQYGSFREPVAVHCFATRKGFAAYSATSVHVRAAAALSDVCLSPKLGVKEDVVRRILTHELSHALLLQERGIWKYHTDTPAWFREGLATYVSEGGGAETISEEQARHAILLGRCFRPDVGGKSASSYGLKPHMFYRQTAMFVTFLHDRHHASFTQFLATLKTSADFDEAFTASFNLTTAEVWAAFVDELE